MHKFKKGNEREFDPEFYRQTRTVPLAWQVYGKHRLGNVWLPLSQQRKSREDAEKDMKILKYSITTKVPPLIKELKLVQVPATKSEMEQRKLLKKLGKHKTLKGFVETIGGTLTETKVGGAVPIRFLKAI